MVNLKFSKNMVNSGCSKAEGHQVPLVIPGHHILKVHPVQGMQDHQVPVHPVPVLVK